MIQPNMGFLISLQMSCSLLIFMQTHHLQEEVRRKSTATPGLEEAVLQEEAEAVKEEVEEELIIDEDEDSKI